MKSGLLVALVVLTALTGACRTALSSVRERSLSTGDDAAGQKRGTIRVEMEADADVPDIQWLLAMHLLEEQGYTIEKTSFADLTLSTVALAEDKLDVASPGNKVAWTAIDKGAPIFTFADTYDNTALLVVRKDIQTCEDLDGMSLAIPSLGAVQASLVSGYLSARCAHVQPRIVILKGGSNRTAALLTGEVDAATQDIGDLIQLEREKPGEFHALAVFAEEFPGMQIASYVVRRGFAEEHPETVKDVIRALFTARRQLQGSEALRRAMIEYLGLEPGEAQEMSQAYVSRGIWDASGTYTLQDVQFTLDFLQEYGELPPGLQAKDVADLSYYDAVVDEIGGE